MASSVSIVANGARTPLGMRAPSSAAALRAGINAVVELPFLRDKLGDPMRMALDAELGLSIMGPERLLALAESALHETCLLLTDAALTGLRVPVYLGLPEFRPGFNALDVEVVREGFRKIEGLPIEIPELNVFTRGHAAGLSALSAASQAIQQGTLEMCLVGGVESYYKPETLEWLDNNRQLAGADSRSSFVPGEGAGFCLVAADNVCRRLNWPTLARVLTVRIGNETKVIKTEEICLGEGLTQTVRGAVGSLPAGETINEVICDINGERYRGEEWGFVCLRLSQYFDDPTNYLSPADCWGDMGAASVSLFVMLACQAAAKGYSKGPRVLLWASSEGGLRGAAVIETM